MTSEYGHLSSDNRAQLQLMLAQGLSMRRDAAALAVGPSTVSHEIKRAGAADGGWYLAVKGDRARSDGRASAGDLIKGAAVGSAAGTLVERTSRYVLLVKLDGAGALSVLGGFTRRLRTVPESLRNTMTYDQGTEVALPQTLAGRLHMNICFCDPHSP